MTSFQLSGAPNFRDLGGYATISGRTVRRHRLFRSDHLGALDAADLETVAGTLGHSLRVFDLRGVQERETAGCAIPGATVHSLPIEPTIVQKLGELIAAGRQLTEDDTVALMQDTYRGFVRGNTPRFAALFTHLLDPHEAPVVFHCTAGKDRTGFAAALLLRALDVPQDIVMHDYLYTNERLAGRLHPGTLPTHVASVLWSVRPEFLHAAFDAVQRDFGSLDGYLREGLGLGGPERERLAELYLETAGR